MLRAGRWRTCTPASLLDASPERQGPSGNLRGIPAPFPWEVAFEPLSLRLALASIDVDAGRRRARDRVARRRVRPGIVRLGPGAL